ncbi:TetR/AcrR family transcriptional regulator [Streptomyces sp. NPDC052107]|uniref:TetR/AcrR family transcriptional regulator n=1 Tax=Streptomyces sp. NPDC052107 TaxID=3155632 RepID=UPI003417730F
MSDSDSAPASGRARRAGRPRSEQARRAVLQACTELLRQRGLRGTTTDLISARSGVSKATIYKWWPSKYAVAVDAFLSEMYAESSDPDTGSAYEDFRTVVRGMIRFYASSTGRVFAALVAEAQSDPAVAVELRDRLITPRRAMVRELWERGVGRGELRADVDPEAAIDLLFGPAMYRLVAGHAPLDEAAADEIVRVAMRGLAS